jgi:hypothetical protein
LYFYLRKPSVTVDEKIEQQLVSAERFKTSEEWAEFNKKWQIFLADGRNSSEEYITYSQGEGARYTCNTEVMQVGEEKLYGCDLNALFVLLAFDSYIKPTSVRSDDPQLTEAVDGLVADSGLLQEAKRLQLLELNELFYNSPTKNTLERFAKLKKIRREYDLKLEKTVDFEAVVIYFHNQIDPKIPLAEAQAAAKTKIDILYNRLKSGEITMEQAGTEIKNDKITGDTTGVSLANLDLVFADNAYIRQEQHKFDSAFFKDTRLDDILRELPEGGMSGVETCKDYKFTSQELYSDPYKDDFPFIDSCYLILKSNKVNFGLLDPGSNYTSAEEYIKVKYKPVTTKKF